MHKLNRPKYNSTKMKSLALGFVILFVYVFLTTATIVVVIFMVSGEKDYSTNLTATTSPSSVKSTSTTNLTITTTNSTTTFTTITTAKNMCVYPDFELQKRIVGGKDAVSNIPWQVLIIINNERMCGGTILDNMTILSAAHCYDDYENPNYTPSIIYAGSTNYVVSEDSQQVC